MHVIAALVDRLARPVGLEEVHHLFQLVDAPATRRERNPHGAVLVGEVARSEPDLDPAVGEQVERGRLRREHGGNVVVHAEHAAADPEPRRGLGRHRHRRDGSEVLRQVVAAVVQGSGAEVVVGDEQGREAESFSLTRELPPR